MNLKDAYAVLEISQTATPDEVKKRYRELTKKYHPDRNKDAGAEDKIKKINEAYQVVTSGKSSDRESIRPRQGQNPFNPFGRQVTYQSSNIDLHITLTFKESIQGCKKEIKYKRQTKCPTCSGNGETKLNNGCVKCGGRGQITGQHNNMVFIQTCDKCYGKSEIESCSTCNTEGTMTAEASITVSIPGGVTDGSTLGLSGMGNFIGNFGPIEQHTDAHLHVKVIPEYGLSLEGIHVVCSLQLSLLEALQGCQKSVNTILGAHEIEIKPQSRNKDEVIIPHLGVSSKGNQRVILDVRYPDNINQLISVLAAN
jgi:molecular chaperone DnaJ